jgi:hypothetical protein
MFQVSKGPVPKLVPIANVSRHSSTTRRVTRTAVYQAFYALDAPRQLPS